MAGTASTLLGLRDPTCRSKPRTPWPTRLLPCLHSHSFLRCLERWNDAAQTC